MKVGLIDVDGHRFPNLALMHISAYHKAHGDDVEWWWSDLVHYDVVYMSKIFSDAYSPDIPPPMNADRVIKGGTGYAIHTTNGKEIFDKEKDFDLPPEVEKTFPDYSIYPQYSFAVSMTSRGCPRGCAYGMWLENIMPWHVARDNPGMFPLWMPLPKLPDLPVPERRCMMGND